MTAVERAVLITDTTTKRTVLMTLILTVDQQIRLSWETVLTSPSLTTFSGWCHYLVLSAPSLLSWMLRATWFHASA